MQKERRIKNQLAVAIAVGTVLTACQVSTPAQAAQQGTSDQPTAKVSQAKTVTIRLVENGRMVDKIVVTGEPGESVPISKAKRDAFVLTDDKQLSRMEAVFVIPQEDQVDWTVTRRHISQQQVHEVVVTVQPEVDHQPITSVPTEEVRLKVVASYQYDRLNKRKVDIKFKLAPGENGVVFPQSLPGYESTDVKGIPLSPQDLVKDRKGLSLFLDNDDRTPLHFTVASHYRVIETSEDSKQPNEGQSEFPDKQDHPQPGADEKYAQAPEKNDEPADTAKDGVTGGQQPDSKEQQDVNNPTQKEPQEPVDESQQTTAETSNVADVGTQTEVESPDKVDSAQQTTEDPHHVTDEATQTEEKDQVDASQQTTAETNNVADTRTQTEEKTPDKVDASQQTTEETNNVVNAGTQTEAETHDKVDASQQTADETNDVADASTQTAEENHNSVDKGTQTPVSEGQADVSQQTDEETNDVVDEGTQTPRESHEKVDSSQQTTGETSHSNDEGIQTDVEAEGKVDAVQPTPEEINPSTDESTQTEAELKDQADASQQTLEETNKGMDEDSQTAVEQDLAKTTDQHSETSTGLPQLAEEGRQKPTADKDSTIPDAALAAETERLSQLDRQAVPTSAKDQLPQTGNSDQGRLIAALGGLFSGVAGLIGAWLSRRAG